MSFVSLISCCLCLTRLPQPYPKSTPVSSHSPTPGVPRVLPVLQWLLTAPALVPTLCVSALMDYCLHAIYQQNHCFESKHIWCCHFCLPFIYLFNSLCGCFYMREREGVGSLRESTLNRNHSPLFNDNRWTCN